MPLIQPKQIKKFIAGRIHVQNVASTASNAVNIDTALATALSTASDQGTSVPSQAYIPDVAPGLMIFPPKNTVEVYDRATRQKFIARGKYEVYGRLEVSGPGPNYRVGYYYFDGSEQQYNLEAAANLDFVIPYMFDFYSLPADFATSLKTQFVNDDPVASMRVYREKLTVTALNTIANLTKPYATGYVAVTVNGQVLDNVITPLAFTVTNGMQTITWSQANAGFPLETTDIVTIEYPY